MFALIHMNMNHITIQRYRLYPCAMRICARIHLYNNNLLHDTHNHRAYAHILCCVTNAARHSKCDKNAKQEMFVSCVWMMCADDLCPWLGPSMCLICQSRTTTENSKKIIKKKNRKQISQSIL